MEASSNQLSELQKMKPLNKQARVHNYGNFLTLEGTRLFARPRNFSTKRGLSKSKKQPFLAHRNTTEVTAMTTKSQDRGVHKDKQAIL